MGYKEKYEEALKRRFSLLKDYTKVCAALADAKQLLKEANQLLAEGRKQRRTLFEKVCKLRKENQDLREERRLLREELEDILVQLDEALENSTKG